MPTSLSLSCLSIAIVAIVASASLPARADVFRVTEGGHLVTEAPYGAQPVQPHSGPIVRQVRGWSPPQPGFQRPTTLGSPPDATSRAAPLRSAPPELRPHFQAAAAQFGLSESLLNAVAFTESRFQVGAVSPAGARGVMQLMPATARDLGVDPADPVQNVMGGARYLRYLLDRFGNNLELALAGYNAGPGAVQRHKGIPPYRETRSYVRQVISRLADEAAAEGR
jgi:soluble lytic murein transglycosylase-like protein